MAPRNPGKYTSKPRQHAPGAKSQHQRRDDPGPSEVIDWYAGPKAGMPPSTPSLPAGPANIRPPHWPPAYTADFTTTGKAATYSYSMGASYCTTCGDWRLADRRAEFNNRCWAPGCAGALGYVQHLLVCPYDCGAYIDSASYKQHLRTYSHYGRSTDNWAWCDTWARNAPEGKDVCPEALWPAEAM